ncbi:hypothetical protein [Paraburkholderia sp. BL10I2N1]|uniref:hypothetical protein n=1 Tax=Paraburkholderia sp. BL10I2N1 TaxID=1938796 RepID=UPI00105DCB1A|nr:hypothetical protein [Paraburkholderia sp. BL10I2N1]TDN57837.1 hypothetical protein B0G77_8678 [Paraburkholderia sp. BL10I2N1]
MSYESGMAKPAISDETPDDGQEHDVHSGEKHCTRGASFQPSPRWAWTAASEHYDWMDNHGPFLCLD